MMAISGWPFREFASDSTQYRISCRLSKVLLKPALCRSLASTAQTEAPLRRCGAR